MGKAGKIIIALVAVAVIAGGAVLLMQPKKADKSSTPAQSSVTITYDGNGFSPESVTVKSGGTVKVVNSSEDEMEFESGPHPAHTANPQLNAGEIAAGASKSFEVTTTGNWSYHNHLHSSQGGTIIVE